MIACVCRKIKDSEYDTHEELKERIMQDDARCCSCQRYYFDKLPEEPATIADVVEQVEIYNKDQGVV